MVYGERLDVNREKHVCLLTSTFFLHFSAKYVKILAVEASGPLGLSILGLSIHKSGHATDKRLFISSILVQILCLFCSSGLNAARNFLSVLTLFFRPPNYS